MRLVLAWLSDPAEDLRRLVAALRPGGWLVAEEMDFVSVAPDPRVDEPARGAFERTVAAHNAVLAARNGFDPAYGRRVAGDLPPPGCTRPQPRGGRASGAAAVRAASSGG